MKGERRYKGSGRGRLRKWKTGTKSTPGNVNGNNGNDNGAYVYGKGNRVKTPINCNTSKFNIKTYVAQQI
jgi:hypothetical protein